MGKIVSRYVVAGIHLIVLACSEAPRGLNDVFLTEFNNAKDVQWEKENDSIWNVSFYQKKFHYRTVSYDLSGQRIAIERQIYEKEVPKNKLAAIKNLYPGCQVFQVFEKETIDGTKYIFEIEYQGELIGVFFEAVDNFKILPKTHKRFRWRYEIRND